MRRLRREDLSRFRPLRLRGLRDHPEAFGSSFEEEQTDDMARMIGTPPNVTLGGFAGNELVGTGGYVVSSKLKQRHKGHVVGFYVSPEWRGSGLARALLDGLIAEARAGGLLLLTLTVTVGNMPARQLYRRAGFVAYGVEPCALRVGDALLDDEMMALVLG